MVKLFKRFLCFPAEVMPSYTLNCPLKGGKAHKTGGEVPFQNPQPRFSAAYLSQLFLSGNSNFIKLLFELFSDVRKRCQPHFFISFKYKAL